MQTKFLKEVVIIVVGKQAEKIVDLLEGKKNVNEFLIAKKLDLTINQTRNILYKLSDNGLVSSLRKKDKKKGWYTYFWKIESIKCLEFFHNFLKSKLEQLNFQIKSRETKLFYVCERCNIEFNEETALLHDFICSECGNVFVLKDNSKLIKEFKREADKLERELKEINEEIRREREKEEKKKIAEIKKITKKSTKKIISKKKLVKKIKKKLSMKNFSNKKFVRKTKKFIKKRAVKKTKKKSVKKKKR